MAWFRDLPLRWKLLLTVALPLLLIALQSAFTYRTVQENLETGTWVAHTHQVIDSANEALLSLVNMETAFRGFLLTGNDDFLAPYNEGQRVAEARLRELQTATADNPQQVRRWQDLEQRAATWQREITEPGIQLRRAVTAGGAPFDAVTSLASSQEGKRQFDGIRAEFAEAIGAERALLDQRERADAASENTLKRTVLLGTLAAILLGAGLAFLLARSLADTVERVRYAAVKMAAGRLDQTVPVTAKDELGQMAAAFKNLTAYLNRMADVAQAIAMGDLRQDVQPQSSEDTLGLAFQRMVANLRKLTREA